MKTIHNFLRILNIVLILFRFLPAEEGDVFEGGIAYIPSVLNLRGEGFQNLPAMYRGGNTNWTGEDLTGIWILQGVEGYLHFVGNTVLGVEVFAGEKNFSSTAQDTSLFAGADLTGIAAFIEWGVPTGRRFEVLVGGSLGLNRFRIHYSVMKRILPWNKLMDPRISPLTCTTMDSGFRFCLKPYISLKYRIMNRLGFEMSTSLLVSRYPQSGWTINGHVPLGDGMEISVFSPGIHLGLMLGL